jgi:hypothetical protein
LSQRAPDECTSGWEGYQRSRSRGASLANSRWLVRSKPWPKTLAHPGLARRFQDGWDSLVRLIRLPGILSHSPSRLWPASLTETHVTDPAATCAPVRTLSPPRHIVPRGRWNRSRPRSFPTSGDAFMDNPEVRITKTPVEARGGFLGRPVLVVLLVSTLLVIGLFTAIYAGYFS